MARIAISGAGIAGLTAALALARRGHAITLHDRSPEPVVTGAGIQLTPNALGVLERLGLGPALAGTLVEPQAVVMRSGRDGREITRMDLTGVRARWGSGWGVIHRADLQAALLSAIGSEPAIDCHWSAAVSGIRDTADGVQYAAGATPHRADMLLVAEGVWSANRAALGLTGPPAYAGRQAWRCVVPREDLPEALRQPVIGLWLNTASHFVHYPLRGGTLVNLVAITREREPGARDWSRVTQGPERLLAAFTGWAPALRDLIASRSDWLTWPLYERPPVDIMARGRLALAGDAAHPMMPFLAQGGGSAIEDAAVLAASLPADCADIPAALQTYALRRVVRVARIQQEAERNGARYHWPAPLSLARDLGLKALGGDAMLRRYDWIYGWTPPGDIEAGV